MIIGRAVSRNTVTIRLTEERWLHIISSHREIDPIDFSKILDVVDNPDMILGGDTDELLAIKKRAGSKIWFVVVYKEVDQKDGFVVTAYLTSDMSWLLKRKILWNKQL